MDTEDFVIESCGDTCFKNSDALFGTLSELRLSGNFCDAVIRVRDQSFPIHRNVMSACSPVFKSLFTMKSCARQRQEVYLPNVTPEAIRLLIDFAYTRTASLTPDCIEAVLPLADMYHVPGLVKLCCEYLHRNLSPTNCLGIMGFAHHHQCVGLERCALRYTLKHFTDVYTQSNEYVQITLDVLVSLLSSDSLNVSCEELVWAAVVRWVEADTKTRADQVARLLRTVRLGLLPSAVFTAKVKEHPLVRDNPECVPIVQDTERFLEELNKAEEPDFDMSLPFARPRLPHEILFVIGGWSGGKPIKMVESYDTRADRWVVCRTEDSGPRAYHGVVALGTKVYVIGGFDATECFSSCRVFDTANQRWSEIAPMNHKRSYVSVALLDGTIYAMGGFEGPPRVGDQNRDPRLRSAERYDPSTNQWTRIQDMCERRSDASATAVQGLVYICGGFNGSDCLSSAESYNPATNQWALLPPMSISRSGVGVINYHGDVFAVGGFDGQTRVCTAEKFNVTERIWSPVPDMYNVRSNFAIEVIDDMVFAIGGFNGETTVYNVECYDSHSDEWYNATDMNLYKSALGACVVKDLTDTRDYVYKKQEPRSSADSHLSRQVNGVQTTPTENSQRCRSPPHTSSVGTSTQYINREGSLVVVPPLDLSTVHSSADVSPMELSPRDVTRSPRPFSLDVPPTNALTPAPNEMEMDDMVEVVNGGFDEDITPEASPPFHSRISHDSSLRDR